MINHTKTKILLHEDECILCRTCQYVCPAGAINIEAKDATHFSFIIWQNSCTLCGNCTYFCPTKAIYSAQDTAPINLQGDKYTTTTSKEVVYQTCSNCNASMIVIPDSVIKKGFDTCTPELRALFNLCPQCRATHTFSKRAF